MHPRTIHIVYLLILFFCLNTIKTEGQIAINEVCPSNLSSYLNLDNRYEDWIEIKNNTSDTIILSNYFLSDDQKLLTKWNFPSRILFPDDFIVVIASGLDTIIQGEIHTSFKLSAQGEALYLSDIYMAVIDSVIIPTLRSDITYGRIPDGYGSFFYFEEGTPGYDNQNLQPYSGIHPRPELNIPSGFYGGQQILSVKNRFNDSEYRYAFNGTTEYDSMQLIAAEISIDSTMIIAIRAKSESLLSSDPVFYTYIIDFQTNLPVISINTDPENLWSDEVGIYVTGPAADTNFPYFGANFWQDWEIQSDIQFFDEDHTPVFNGEFGLQVHGGVYARTRPMKPLRIIADRETGPQYIAGQLFADKDLDRFHRLILRNAGSEFNRSHCTDGFIHRAALLGGLNLDVAAYRPVVVFLNGKYWGIHNLREKQDEYYLSTNHNIPFYDYDIIENDTLIVSGNMEKFDSLYSFAVHNDLSIDDNFVQIGRMLDIPSYHDYYIAETFFNNFDWPYNNIKIWRARNDTSRFRYLFFDLDVSMNNYGWAKHDKDCLGNILGAYGDSSRHVRIFKSLLKNTEFRNYFVNRYCDLVNTSFSSATMNALFGNVVDDLQPNMKMQFDRWQGPSTTYWNNYYLSKPREFIAERPYYALEQLNSDLNLNGLAEINIRIIPEDAGALKLNTIRIDTSQWKGKYIKGIPVSLKAEQALGYTFSHFEMMRANEFVYLPSTEISFADDEEIRVIFTDARKEIGSRVFPNPADQECYYEFISEHEIPAEIRIFSITGELLKSERINCAVGTNYISFSVDNFKDGFYLISADNGINSYYSKFVVTHK